ncbi:MAG: AbrB/MazE/SpoVT family DNA-binding domain-containing protein [bacterium]|nr:AbrB/MazE/SpoVT family DNA-binding domain-containing protein [bacterium]
MDTIAVLSSKGQVTIPKHIRETLALQQSHRLLFTTTPTGMLVGLPLNRDFLSFGGSVRPKKKPEDFDAIRKAVQKRIAQETIMRASR